MVVRIMSSLALTVPLTQAGVTSEEVTEDIFSIDEAPGYVEPSLQDLLFLDLKHETLMDNIGYCQW